MSWWAIVLVSVGVGALVGFTHAAILTLIRRRRRRQFEVARRALRDVSEPPS